MNEGLIYAFRELWDASARMVHLPPEETILPIVWA